VIPMPKPNLRILVVEDEQPLIEAIKKKLELSGFQVLSARSVKQAIDYLNTISDISIVWLDHYLMGKETGMDFITWMKAEERFKNMPIFVVSNTVTSDKVTTYLALGADKYYAKANYRLDQIIADIKKSIAQT